MCTQKNHLDETYQQYSSKQRIKCLAQTSQHSTSTSGHSIPSLTLYVLSHWAPPEDIMSLPIQYFEAEFLWKLSFKSLNSSIYNAENFHPCIWALMRENLSVGVWEQQRHTPACTSAHTDQCLCYSHFEKYHI